MRPITIEFINHACVIIDTGSARILCDPWLSGSAFDNGWDLLVATGLTINDLDFTHIWLSHEHPDHFCPAELKRLAEERRKNTPVLYQKTRDGRVLSFCKALGYQPVELYPFEARRLTEDTTVMCDAVAGYDSWLHVDSPGGSVFNANDCRLWNPADLKEIKDKIGYLDLLMTQFGYANWAGNPDDDDSPKRAAAKSLRQVQAQVEYLAPKRVLPFASFVWFSHKENHFWNRRAVRVHDVVPKLEALGTKPVVMFPGDHWRLGDPFDNQAALAHWDRAYKAVDGRYLHEAEPLDLSALQKTFEGMRNRLKQRNDWEAIMALKYSGDLPASLVYLTDLGQAASFDIAEGLGEIDSPPEDCDVRLGSAALNYLMKYNWGRGTVTINGRFEANYKTLWRFFRQTRINYANNIGQFYPENLCREEVLNSRSFIMELVGDY